MAQLLIQHNLGSTTLSAHDQTANIYDWLDKDSHSFKSQEFDGKGDENAQDKELYFNRYLNSIYELLLIPGMDLYKFKKIRNSLDIPINKLQLKKINVNTAPIEVLKAIGLEDSIAEEVIALRTSSPITQKIINTLIPSSSKLKKYIGTRSYGFTCYTQVKMNNTLKFMKAYIDVRKTGKRRRSTLLQAEVF